MLTIFSIPKPFIDPHISTIQCNAVASWVHLKPACEIILCGDDEGVAEVAREFGIGYLPELDRNEYGTPLLNSAFAKVQEIARFELTCYVNADIIFMTEFLDAVASIPFNRFLALGRRWDVDIVEPLDFEMKDWEDDLKRTVTESGELQFQWAIDYFVFPTGSISAMPEFAVGRPVWDNWLVYRTRELGVPVVDLTPSVMAVHQNHGYGHVPERIGERWEGPEASVNRGLMKNAPLFGVHYATHYLESEKVHRALSDQYLESKMAGQSSLPERYPHLEPIRSRLFWRIYHRRDFFPDQLWRRLVYYLTP